MNEKKRQKILKKLYIFIDLGILFSMIYMFFVVYAISIEKNIPLWLSILFILVGVWYVFAIIYLLSNKDVKY